MIVKNYQFPSPTPIELSCIARKWGGPDEELSMEEFMKRLAKKDSKLFNKLESFLAMAKSGVYQLQEVPTSDGCHTGWCPTVWLISSHNMCWATTGNALQAPFEFFSEDQLYVTVYMKVEGMERAVPIDLAHLTRI